MQCITLIQLLRHMSALRLKAIREELRTQNTINCPKHFLTTAKILARWDGDSQPETQ